MLHVAPHPDDELLGAPATLMALRDAGHRVVNLAVGLGRPADRPRRRRELEAACAAAGFELLVAAGAPGIGASDDLAAARAALAALLGRALDELRPALVVSPSPHDRHHGHEVVARALFDALESRPVPPAWWMWGLWGPLPLPTLVVPVDEARIEEVLAALGEHAGELARNDYRRLLSGRAQAQAVLGAELVFGFGAPALGAPGAELLTEARRDGRGAWRLGAPRLLDPARPLAAADGPDARAWLEAPSAAGLVLR